MRAVDGIVLVVDSVESIMPQTETVLRQALKEKVRPVLFINKIDRLINELKLKPEDMQARLINIINGVNKLIAQAAPDELKQEWLIGVEKGNVAFGSAYNKWALSFNYMKARSITFKDIYEYCSSARHKELSEKAPIDEVVLDMAIRFLPTPMQAQKYRVPVIWHGDAASTAGKSMLGCDPNAKICATVTGVAVDEHAGEVATCRVFSGTLRKGAELYLASKYATEKIQQVAIYMGPDRVIIDEVPAGNIAAIIGMKELYVGETLSEEKIEPFERISHYSEPVVTKSIEAKNTRDLMKLIEVLRQIAKEDPTVRVEINQETGEHLISGMGELHLEIIEYKISKERGVEIETSKPIVVYRETVFGKSAEVEGKSPNKHNKFYITVEPVEEGVYKEMLEGNIPDGKPKGKELVEKMIKAGMERLEAKNVLDIYNRNVLVDATKGVQYLNEVMELLLQGFEEAMDNGPLAKEKVTGVKVVLHDAALHEDPVHRGPAQILPAVRRPIYAAMLLAGAVLLEPKQKIFVQAPQDYMGEMIKQVQGRRGQVLDIQQEGELVSIRAKTPVAEMFGFANDIRSATQGRAIWYHEYAGYERVSAELQGKIVPQIRERKGEKKEIPTPQFFMD
jgi:elongation factor 2